MTMTDDNAASLVLKRKDESSYTKKDTILSPDAQITIEVYNLISIKLLRKQRKPGIDVEERPSFKESVLEQQRLIERVQKEQPEYAKHLLRVYTCVLDQQNCPVVVYDSPLSYEPDGKVPYRTLQQVLAASTNQRIAVERIFQWMKVLVALLTSIHEQGTFININSNNILIGKDDQLYLLPTSDRELTVEAARYRAPENYDEQFGKPGPQSDVYALTLLFYQMVSGTFPFSGDSTHVLPGQHRKNAPVFSNIPSEEYRAVFAKALAKQVEDRYQTVEQLLQALQQAYQTKRFRWPLSLRKEGQTTQKIEEPDMLRREILINMGTGIGTGLAALAVYEVIRNHLFQPAISVASKPFKHVMDYSHESGVNDIQVSSDGRLLASADTTGYIKCLDMKSWQLVHLPRYHKHSIVSIAWSPAPYAGKYLAVIGDDGWLFIRTMQGKEVAKHKFDGENFTLAWSEQHLSVGIDNTMIPYDNPIQFKFGLPDNVYETDSNNIVNAIAPAPGTSPWIAVANDNGVFQIWNVEAKIAIPVDTFPYGGALLATKWSPDGHTIAFTGKDGMAFVIAAPPDQEKFITTWKMSNSQLNSISWNVDNKRFAVGGDDGQVLVGNIHYRTLGGFTLKGSVQAVAFTPDNKFLIAAGLGGDVQIRQAS